MYKTKSLAAALGTSGACGMFSNKEIDGEAISFGKEEAKSVMDELNSNESGDVIALGSPQLGSYELELISNMMGGKKFSKKCMIFCARPTYEKACSSGIAQKLESAGANIICDACTCLSPLLTHDEYDGVITNSIKAAHYLNKSNRDICLFIQYQVHNKRNIQSEIELNNSLKCKVIVGGSASGRMLVTRQPINFLSSVDHLTGMITDSNHELYGQCLKNSLLVFPYAVGSSVGAYSIFALKSNGVSPSGIICTSKD